MNESDSISESLIGCSREKVVFKNCFMLSTDLNLSWDNQKQFQVDCVLISSDVYMVNVKLMPSPSIEPSESSWRDISICTDNDDDETKMEA